MTSLIPLRRWSGKVRILYPVYPGASDCLSAAKRAHIKFLGPNFLRLSMIEFPQGCSPEGCPAVALKTLQWRAPHPRIAPKSESRCPKNHAQKADGPDCI